MARGLRLAACALGLALVSAVGDCHVAVYVDANASGAEDGSKAHPYKTIQKAIDQTSIPVAVVIAPGTYAGFTISGRSGVSFQSASATKPVIDGTALMSTLITITGSTDIELRGLAIEVGTNDAILVTNGSSVTLSGVTMEAPPAPAWPNPAPSARLVVADTGTSVVVEASRLHGGLAGVFASGPATSVRTTGATFEVNSYGVWVVTEVSLTVSDSTITESGTVGILSGSAGTTVSMDAGSSIVGGRFLGLVADHGVVATLDGASFVGIKDVALNSQYGSTIVATGALIDGNGVGAAGYAGYAELVSCTLRNNKRGVSTTLPGGSVLVRDGTVIEGSLYGVDAEAGPIVVDGSMVKGNSTGVTALGSSSTATVRNGSIVEENTGTGVWAQWGSKVIVSSSTVRSNGANGLVCDHAVCDVGAGVGLGNTIAGHSGAGQYGIRCLNAGVVNCAAGENAFSDNATDIDPACAATCAR